MLTIDLKSTFDLPESLLDYPDFIITQMIVSGPCAVEADFILQEDGLVPLVLAQHSSPVRRVLARVKPQEFRTLLASISKRFSIDNCYAGQILFSCESEREESISQHRFSLFLCNEPTMGFWMRLYLYSIDGVFPSFNKK